MYEKKELGANSSRRYIFYGNLSCRSWPGRSTLPHSTRQAMAKSSANDKARSFHTERSSVLRRQACSFGNLVQIAMFEKKRVYTLSFQKFLQQVSLAMIRGKVLRIGFEWNVTAIKLPAHYRRSIEAWVLPGEVQTHPSRMHTFAEHCSPSRSFISFRKLPEGVASVDGYVLQYSDFIPTR